MKIKGKISAILDLQSGTGKTGKQWRKQDYILKLDSAGEREHLVCYSLFNDRIDSCARPVGTDVTVDIAIESHEWNGRWFTSVNAFDVTDNSAAQMPPAPAPYAPADSGTDDGLPF